MGAAISKAVGDLSSSSSIGDPEKDTPLLLTVTDAIATQATTGTVTCNLVLRAYDDEIDG